MTYQNISVADNSPVSYLPQVPSFGENLTRIRKAAGLKSKDVAERLDVARSVVSGWENDRRGLPETPTLFKLAKALGCSIEELLSGVDAEYAAAAEARTKQAMALFGRNGDINFDEPGAWDRFNEAQALFAEARDADEHARIARALQFAATTAGASGAQLSDEELEHLARWRRLPDRARQSIEVIMRDLVPEEATSERQSAKKRKTA